GVVLGGPTTIAASGTITLASTGSIGINGNNASSITLSAAGASSDILLAGDPYASPGPITLVAGRAITQTGGLIDTVGTLTGSAGTSVDLPGSNTISNLGGFTSGGAFNLHETLGGAGLSVTAPVSTGGAPAVAHHAGPLAIRGGTHAGAAT